MDWIGLDRLSQTRPIPRSPDGDKNIFDDNYRRPNALYIITLSCNAVQNTWTTLLTITVEFLATTLWVGAYLSFMLTYINITKDRRGVRFESLAMCQMPFTIRVTDQLKANSQGQRLGIPFHQCNWIYLLFILLNQEKKAKTTSCPSHRLLVTARK